MADIFAATGINPAEQMPPEAQSNAELGNPGPTTLEAMASQTPKFAPTDAIKNLDAMSAPPGDMAQPDISQPAGDSGAQALPPAARAAQPDSQLEAGNNIPQQDENQPAQSTFEGGARDLLKAHDIAPPSLQAVNQAAFSNGVNLNDPQGSEQQAVANYANDVNKQYNTIAQTRYTPEQQQALKDKGPVGFFEMFSKLHPVNIGPAPGIATPLAAATRGLFSDTVAANQIKDIADKAHSGQSLSATETSKLQDYIDNQVEINQRGLSWGGKAAQVIAGLPSSLQSLASAPRVDSEKSNAPTVPVGQSTQSSVKTPFMPASYIPQYGEVSLNDSLAVTDKGQMIYKSAQEMPAMSTLKQFGYIAKSGVEGAADALDVYNPHGLDFETNEMLTKAGIFNKTGENNPIKSTNEALIRGGALLVNTGLRTAWAPVAGLLGAAQEAAKQTGNDQLASTIEDLPIALMGDHAIANTLHETPAISPILNSAVSKLPVSVQDAIYSAHKVIQPNATLSKTLSASGWQKALTDLGEDGTANALHDALGLDAEKDYNHDDYMKSLVPNPQQTSLETGLVSITGGVHETTDVAMKIMTDNGVKPSDASEALKNMSALEKEAFISQNTPDPVSLYPEVGASPELYLHGSTRNFDNFYPSKEGAFGSGVYLTTDKGDAIEYAKGNAPGFGAREGFEQNSSNSTLYEVRPNVSKTISVFDAEQRFAGSGMGWHQVNDVLKNEGYQALTDSDGKVAMVFNPNDLEIVNKHSLLMPIATPESVRTPIYSDAIQGSAETSIINSQVQVAQETNPPLIQERQSAFNDTYKNDFQVLLGKAGNIWDQTYRLFIDELHPANELTKRARESGLTVPDAYDTKLLGQVVRQTDAVADYNLTVGTTLLDDDGNLVKTGKSVKSSYDDFDNLVMDIEPNRDIRRKDLGDYRIARHLLDQEEKGNSIATPDQLEFYKNRVSELANKYGSKAPWLETISAELTDANARLTLNGVRTGRISQKTYDSWRAQSPKYVSLSRVLPEATKMAEPDATDFPGARNTSLGRNVHVGAFKSLEGNSDLPFRDPLLSDMINARAIMASAFRNRYIESIYKLKDFTTGISLEDAPIKSPAVTGAYDPKLRAKLDIATEYLGGSVERVNNIDNAPGMKNTLGSYDPMEDLVRLKLGTTEGTQAHEVGHQLDKKLGLQEKMLSDPQIKSELQKLAEDRLNSDISLRQDENTDNETRFQEERKPVREKYLQYIKSDPEILANFIDAYVNSPEKVNETAPNAKTAFESIIDADPKLAFIKDIKPSTARATEVLSPQTRENFGPKSSVPFYVNGELKYLVVPHEIYDALNSFSPVQRNAVEKFLGNLIGVPTKILKGGSTHIPTFFAGHFQRALGLSFLNGKATPMDWGQAIFNVMEQGENFKKWKASSGGMQMRKLLGEDGLNKELNKVFSPSSTQKFLDGFGGIYDKTARVAVYNKSKSLGESDIRAGVNSLDATGNYFRRGKLTRAADKVSPFIGDAFQGADRFIRGFAKDPGGYAIRAVGALMLPQLYFSGLYLYGSDDETRKEYLRFTEQDRAAYMMVKAGGDWYRLRRPFAPGYIFGAVPEQAMLYAYNQNLPNGENFWRKMVSNIGNSVIPIDDGTKFAEPLTKTMIEMHDNADWFRNKPIYSSYQKHHPEDEINAGTSETGKELGKLSTAIMGKGNGISPAKFDFAVQSLTGNAGKYGLQASDYLINHAKSLIGAPVAQKPESTGPDTLVSEATGLGALQERMPRGYWTQPVQDFYKNLDSVQADTSKITQKSLGSTVRGAVKNAKETADPGFSILTKASAEMTATNAQIKAIEADTNLSGHDKRIQIEPLQDKITSIAEQANSQYYQQRGNK